jgi:hypothetical protein
MDAKQQHDWAWTPEIIWAIALASAFLSLALTLLVSAAFPIFVAWAVHFVASTLFLRRGLEKPSFAAVVYWGCSNALLLGVAIWGFVKVPEGLLFL